MFDYLQHYIEIYLKYNKFIKDFKLLAHVAAVEITKKNPYQKCHYHDSEPFNHAQAKNKIFQLFLRNHSYLVETELGTDKQLDVFHKEDLAYRFDILVVNVINFVKLNDCILNVNLNNNPLDIEKVKQLEQCSIFAIEIDNSTSHIDRKDNLRDDFFFTEYNIVTVRYNVDHLVPTEETAKERNTRMRYSLFKRETDPLFANITTDQIVEECRNIYRTKYPHLQ